MMALPDLNDFAEHQLFRLTLAHVPGFIFGLISSLWCLHVWSVPAMVRFRQWLGPIIVERIVYLLVACGY
ncbi:hypothetical protein ACLB2K_001659 [Fragaria x ananassa]